MAAPLHRAAGPFFTLGIVVLVVACLTLTRDYAVPIAIAVFVWVLIGALAGVLRRLPGLRATLPDWAAKLIAVALMFGAILLSVQIIARNVGELGESVTGESVILSEVEALGTRIGLETGVTLGELFERLEFQELIGWGLSTVQGLITDVSLVFLYVLFLLVDERFYDAKMRALFPDPARRQDIEASVSRVVGEVTIYLWLMTLISLGVAFLTWVFCRAVGLDGAGFWAFLAFALNFVPTIGSITAVVLPALYGVLTLDDPVLLAVLIGGLAATQIVAGELVLPRLMGDRLNLSSFVIILTLVAWGAMWGPAGMFLAIPITVVLVMISARFESTRPIAILLSKDGRVPPARAQRPGPERAAPGERVVELKEVSLERQGLE
jgi:AI-2 transport protein TqsA